MARPRVVGLSNAHLSAEVYLEELKKLNLKPEEVVFPFPVNAIETTKKHNIHQRYSDKKTMQTGLPNVADILSDLHVPTLDLALDDVALAHQADVVESAFKSLWTLLGFGYSIVYPDAWISKTPANPVLDALYKQQFDLMKKFAESTLTDPSLLVDSANLPEIENHYVQSFHAGAQLKVDQSTTPALLKNTLLEPAEAPLARNSGNFSTLHQQQRDENAWKSYLAIAVSVLTAGLLAIPAYLWWRSSRNDENIQEMRMKPVDFAAVQQHTQRVLNSTADAQAAMQANPILHRVGKPQKQMPDEKADATVEQSYFMDKHAKSRFELVKGMFDNNQTQISSLQLAAMESLTEESMKLAPTVGL